MSVFVLASQVGLMGVRVRVDVAAVDVLVGVLDVLVAVGGVDM